MKCSYSYSVDKLKPLKLVLLTIALLIDLVLVFSIPSIILQPKILYITISVFILNLVLKISTIYLTYNVNYTYFRNKLVVKKTFYRKNYQLLEVDKKDIIAIIPVDENNQAKRIVNNYKCMYNEYCVETTKGNYILSLSDNLIASLLCEEKYDLFR